MVSSVVELDCTIVVAGYTSDEAFCAVVNTHKRRSNEIYKSELTMIKIQNQVKCKYRVDPQRTRLSLIAKLTWSNLGLK